MARSRIIVVGEVTQWAKQFVSVLQSAQAFEFVFEHSPEKFLESTQVGQPQILILENGPGSRQHITRLRASGRRLFILWIGRTFSKDDFEFGLAQRVYAVLEDPKPEDPSIQKSIKGAIANVDSAVSFDQVLRSLKSVLLQHESDTDKPFLSEIKTAILKIERSASFNEFSHPSSQEGSRVDTSLPFHETQALSDAIMTVHELERTGALRVRGGAQQEGVIEFLQGKLISAHAGSVVGLKALYRIFNWDNHQFMFTRRDVKSESIQTDLNGELSEICLIGDGLKSRYEKIRKEIPPAGLVVAMEPKWLQISTSLSPNLFSTLCSVIEFGQIGLVMDYNSLPDVDVLENLIALKRSRAIKVVATRAPLAL